MTRHHHHPSQLAANCHAINHELALALDHYVHAIMDGYRLTEVEMAAIAESEAMLEQLRSMKPEDIYRALKKEFYDEPRHADRIVI